jgi:hypothetical protein
LVDDDAVGRVAGIERGEIDENLEQRSRLTACLDRAIELALGIIPAADEREDRAVRRERDDRRPADMPANALLTEPFFDDAFGRLLEARIEGRIGAEVDRRRADQTIAARALSI